MKIDFSTFNPEVAQEELKQELLSQGGLTITDLVNQSVEHSPLLSAIAEAVGGDPFIHVAKATWEDRIADVMVQYTPELLQMLLPTHIAEAMRFAAADLQRKELKSKNPLFQVYKRALCQEIVTSVLAQTGGTVHLKFDDNYGTNFKFNHAHASEEKKQAIAEQQEARAANSGGAAESLNALRARYRS